MVYLYCKERKHSKELHRTKQMKNYYYVSIINDTTNIYKTTKKEAEKELNEIIYDLKEVQ